MMKKFFAMVLALALLLCGCRQSDYSTHRRRSTESDGSGTGTSTTGEEVSGGASSREQAAPDMDLRQEVSSEKKSGVPDGPYLPDFSIMDLKLRTSYEEDSVYGRSGMRYVFDADYEEDLVNCRAYLAALITYYDFIPLEAEQNVVNGPVLSVKLGHFGASSDDYEDDLDDTACMKFVIEDTGSKLLLIIFVNDNVEFYTTQYPESHNEKIELWNRVSKELFGEEEEEDYGEDEGPSAPSYEEPDSYSTPNGPVLPDFEAFVNNALSQKYDSGTPERGKFLFYEFDRSDAEGINEYIDLLEDYSLSLRSHITKSNSEGAQYDYYIFDYTGPYKVSDAREYIDTFVDAPVIIQVNLYPYDNFSNINSSMRFVFASEFSFVDSGKHSKYTGYTDYGDGVHSDNTSAQGENITLGIGETTKLKPFRELNASSEVFYWQVRQGEDIVELSSTSSSTCTVRGLRAGTAVITVAYTYGIKEPHVLNKDLQTDHHTRTTTFNITVG